MAQRIQILLEDDLDGSEASQSINFSVDSTDYVIDLSDSNADEFREVMKKYVGAARKTARGTAPKPRRSSRDSGEPAPAAVRAWAESNGIEVNNRGRVKQDVIDQYVASLSN